MPTECVSEALPLLRRSRSVQPRSVTPNGLVHRSALLLRILKLQDPTVQSADRLSDLQFFMIFPGSFRNAVVVS